MTFTIIGLGNPGQEYENTRHNTGRIILEGFRKTLNFPEWKLDKKSNAQISKGEIGKHKIVLVCPETFMNKSGLSAKNFIKNLKDAERTCVIYDDLDLPFRTNKMVFNRGSGGHKGIESIVRNIKTEAFLRIRIGISPTTPSGKIKKPKGEDAVGKFILDPFKKEELDEIKKTTKKVVEGLDIWINGTKDKAMSFFN